ncbi:MAG TPA: hypothetical protein VNR37_04995 [Microbacteriaceae bacterium]|nr:hypothetical protein [Microbacteriaceae bacterium]
MPQEFWLNAIYSLIPTIVLGLLFWMILRAVLRADRTERAISARIENEERVKAGLPPKPFA